MFLVPIIFVPSNEKPHVFRPKQLLFVNLAQDLPRSLGIKKANNNPGILSLQIGHRCTGRFGKNLSSRYGYVSQFSSGLQVIQGLWGKKCENSEVSNSEKASNIL